MKKFILIVFSISIILLTSGNVHAQLVQIGAGGGLTSIVGPDFYKNSISDQGLGFSSGYNLGVLVKVGLPVVPITPRGIFLYNHFSNSEGTIDYSQTITSLGLGVQYGFIPIPAGVDPYLFLDLMYNNLGEISGLGNTSGNAHSRFGLQLGVGTEITILPILNLDVFAGYNWYNLTGKENGEDTVSAWVLDLFVMFSLL